MHQLPQWLEDNPLAGAIFFAMCLIGVGSVSEIMLRWRVQKLKHEISRLERDLGDARAAVAHRLTERIRAQAAPKDSPKLSPLESDTASRCDEASASNTPS